jgi:hypothetical protein
MYYNVQPVSSGGLVASAQIKVISPTVASGGRGGHLHWLALYNNNAAVRYAMLFDSASLPADGAAPLWMQSMAAATSVVKELAWPPDGLWFQNGIWICISTTASTKTLAAADLIFTAGVS